MCIGLGKKGLIHYIRFRSTPPGLVKYDRTRVCNEQLSSPTKSGVTTSTDEGETFTLSNSSSSDMLSEEMGKTRPRILNKTLEPYSLNNDVNKKNGSAFSCVKPKLFYQNINKSVSSERSGYITNFSLELSKSSSNTSSSSFLSSGSLEPRNYSGILEFFY